MPYAQHREREKKSIKSSQSTVMLSYDAMKEENVSTVNEKKPKKQEGGKWDGNDEKSLLSLTFYDMPFYEDICTHACI